MKITFQYFRNRLYFLFKPWIPRVIRLRIRMMLARRIRRQSVHIWPIYSGSESLPDGWPGWPGGKEFAVVLTHDVESKEGLARVKQLAQIEMEFGFRSSFNFVPEGDYAVSDELRNWLTENGFEVGVHDLRHDGCLYVSRRQFSKNASRINDYIRRWGAAGFRAGFMFHNLAWHHELEIDYDASTFDTDPFEPQPEGRHTIFPFWVEAPEARGKQKVHGVSFDNGHTSSIGSETEFSGEDACESARNSKMPGREQCPPFPVFGNAPSGVRRSGYVELPYTLPQDSTLFILLGEPTAEIWVQKVDWIAKHRGMALVNVHPDYLRFQSEPHSLHTFPVERYLEFLAYVRDSYKKRYWHALPRDVAAFVYRSKKAAARNLI